MPSRIIRESARSSPTLDQLSPEAERFFWRLTTVADDFGRFEADPRILLSECFPLKNGTWHPDQVVVWYGELETAGLVTTYAANGRRLGAFVTWAKHQRCRARESKYPAPPPDAGTGGHLLSSDGSRGQPTSNAAGGIGYGIENGVMEAHPSASRRSAAPLPGSGPGTGWSESPGTSPAANPGDSGAGLDRTGHATRARVRRTAALEAGELRTWFDGVFWPLYPWKLAKPDAEKAVAALNPDADLRATILAAIAWQKRHGCLVPSQDRAGKPVRLYPASWLNARRWEDEPDEPTPEVDSDDAFAKLPVTREVPEGTAGAFEYDGVWLLEVGPDDPRHPDYRPKGPP